jgi:hypothetical protein
MEQLPHKCSNVVATEFRYGIWWYVDHLCGQVVTVPGYRSRGPGLDSRRYQMFWEVGVLEWGQLSLMSTNEELLGRYSSGSGLESREYDRRDPVRWPRDTLYLQKFTNSADRRRSLGIVRSRTKATEIFFNGGIGNWLYIVKTLSQFKSCEVTLCETCILRTQTFHADNTCTCDQAPQHEDIQYVWKYSPISFAFAPDGGKW